METGRVFLPFLCCVVGLLLIGVPGSHGETEQNCLMQATTCQAPVIKVAQQAGATGPSLQQLCPLYPTVKTCMGGLDASCQTMETIMNMTTGIDLGIAGCDALSGGGTCPGAMNCFASMASSGGISLQCEAVRGLTMCLKNLKQAPNSCSFDETKVTFVKLESLVTEFCTDVAKFPEQEFNCSATDACTQSSPELGLSALGNTADMSATFAFVKKIANPPELCKILEVGVGCAVTSKDACKYPADFVAAMTTLKQKLTAGCFGTGGAAMATGNIMLWLAASLVAVMTALV